MADVCLYARAAANRTVGFRPASDVATDPAQGPSWVNSGRLSPTEDLVHRRVFDLKGRLKAPATRVSAAKSLVRLKPH